MRAMEAGLDLDFGSLRTNAAVLYVLCMYNTIHTIFVRARARYFLHLSYEKKKKFAVNILKRQKR